MERLFSHTTENHAIDGDSTVLRDRAAQADIPLPPSQVSEAFTDLIHLWWPLAEYSVFGAESHVEFDDGQLVEEALDGRQFLWATVLDSQPSQLKLAWFLGAATGSSTNVSVDFEALETGCRLSLRQNGWQPGASGKEQFEKYQDWPHILASFSRFMGV
ncbi:SRPBCC family protein [Renibacterium salmoninarum]|nr:hypothetical protein [Renibacterium salmoninarum]